MKLSYKIISLCLCFSVVAIASDIQHNVKLKINQIGVKEVFEAGPSIDYEPSSRTCADSFVAHGSDPTGSYYGPCWSDGSGYFYFYWEGGCLATTIIYSAGEQDISGYGFTEGFYFYGFDLAFFVLHFLLESFFLLI